MFTLSLSPSPSLPRILCKPKVSIKPAFFSSIRFPILLPYTILFSMHMKVSVNSSKTKIMLVKNQKRDKPCIMYNNESLECVENFKYLGLEVLSNHRWNECATYRLEAGKREYYTFENTWNCGDIKCWVLKKYLFYTLVTPVLLYGVEVWGGSIPKSTWKVMQGCRAFVSCKVSTS